MELSGHWPPYKQLLCLSLRNLKVIILSVNIPPPYLHIIYKMNNILGQVPLDVTQFWTNLDPVLVV